jgi:DNA gyrase/topoisomerase IV subunit A
MMCDNNCCNHTDGDMVLLDFEDIRKEIAELKEIIEQEKRQQELIKNELSDLSMRLDIVKTQINSMR